MRRLKRYGRWPSISNLSSMRLDAGHHRLERLGQGDMRMSLGEPCWHCTHELENHAQAWPHPCTECDECMEFMPIDDEPKT